MKLVELSINNHIVDVIHKRHITNGTYHKRAQWACLTYHAACKVEFQPPIGRTHSWRFSIFFKNKIEKRQLWVRPIEWLKLNFASCVVHVFYFQKIFILFWTCQSGHQILALSFHLFCRHHTNCSSSVREIKIRDKNLEGTFNFVWYNR